MPARIEFSGFAHDAEVIEWLGCASEDFIARDWLLIEDEASERAITHRLAVYLERHAPAAWRNLHFDCEYNRQGENGNVKKLAGKCGLPDILVHLRGDDSENVLAVEAKPASAPVDDLEKDRVKLRALLGERQYRFAYVLTFASAVSGESEGALIWERIAPVEYAVQP